MGWISEFKKLGQGRWFNLEYIIQSGFAFFKLKT